MLASQLKGHTDCMVDAMPQYKELVKQLARVQRMAYDAYIVEGFTPEQATILCQSLLPHLTPNI